MTTFNPKPFSSRESPRGAKPLFLISSPSPSKERGIEGVRMI